MIGREIIEKYRRFVSELPEAEKDMPYLKAPNVCEEDFLSPRDVLRHLEKQDPCGQKLQEMREELMRG